MTKNDLIEMLSVDVAETVQDEDVLLTVDQVAMQFGVSAQTIRNWEIQGKLVPCFRTETETGKGHRRYTQSAVTQLKKKQNNSEILFRIKPKKLLEGIEKLTSTFQPDEEITVSVVSDTLNRVFRITFDSEDGLQTFTKTFKMED